MAIAEKIGGGKKIGQIIKILLKRTYSGVGCVRKCLKEKEVYIFALIFRKIWRT